jgi:hypothetical protein
VAELVETLDPGAVAKAAARLIDDEGHRRRLAWAALEAGRSMFSQEAAFSVLSRCLLG